MTFILTVKEMKMKINYVKQKKFANKLEKWLA